MTRTPVSPALLALCAAGLMPSSVAHAQWYYTPSSAATRPAPLYPYEVQPGQPYAIEVAPGAYVIQRPVQRAYPRVQRASPPPKRQSLEARARKFDRPPKPADRGLIEELRERKIKRKVVHTKKIVREKPIVIETRRVVDDPPRVVERYHYVDDPPLPPVPPRQRHAKGDPGAGLIGDGRRVIHADAVVTIFGPDRMSIRLMRKPGPDAIGEPLAQGDAIELAVPLAEKNEKN
jgi:hypothetical protein